MKFIFFSFLFVWIFTITAQAQQSKLTIRAAIDHYAGQLGVESIYKSEWFDVDEYTLAAAPESLEALNQLLRTYGLKAIVVDEHLIVVLTNTIQASDDSRPNKKIQLTGTVRSASDNSPLIGAVVYTENQSSVSDSYGNYFLEESVGRIVLHVKYIGWEPYRAEIIANESMVHSIEMYEDVTRLDEVIISSKRDDSNISDTQMSTVAVKIESIKDLPALMGEVDVLRTLQQVPGVQTVGEGSAGVNVRGGEVQENLILVSGMPLYNPSHMFGFFSAINSDLLQGFEIKKGGIGALYGGRTGAVITMDVKPGSFQDWSASTSISNLLAKGVIGGPLIKNKLSILASGRISYTDYLLKRVEDVAIVTVRQDLTMWV